MAVVLQEICNDVIEQARNIIQPTELFGAEPEEAAERIRTALKVCESFKSAYLNVKAKTATTKRPWNFEGKSIFGRLDAFMARGQDVLDLFQTIIEFNKLEKIEIGGTKVSH